jgi:hypothetical protein
MPCAKAPDATRSDLILRAVGRLPSVSRFWVGYEHALIVSKYRVAGALRYHIGWQDWYLAATVWGIHHEQWDRHTTDPAAEILHDLNAPRYWGAEVFDTLDQVALVQVVGSDPHPDQAATQLLHDLRIVIYTP